MFKRAMKLTIALMAFITLIFICNAGAINNFAHQDQTRRADCAIVAGAGISGNGPSPVFKARLDHAAELNHRRIVSAVILTGGYSQNASRADSAVARDYLLAQGVSPSAIFIEEKSTVTRENIRYAKAIMTRQKFHSALLVSDPLHMMRLKMIALDNGINGWSSPTRQSRYQSWSAWFPFLLREAFYYTGYRLLRLLPATPV